MSALTPLGIAALSVVLSLILRECGFRGVRLFSAVSTLAIIFVLSEGVGTAVRMLGESAEAAGVGDGAKCVLKIIGISYAFGFGADMCRELGEVGISSAVLVAGRVEIFLVGAPYLTELLSVAVGLLGKG